MPGIQPINQFIKTLYSLPFTLLNQINILTKMTVFLFLVNSILLSYSGCKSTAVNELPAISITDSTNHIFTYTNKISGFYMANTHSQPLAYFDGWTVNEYHYLQDYNLLADSNLIRRRDSIKTFLYYPHCFRREYHSGLSETFTMLDSIDALVWELEWKGKAGNLSFAPLLPAAAAQPAHILSRSNPHLILSPADLSAGSANSELFWMRLDWILLNPDRLLITATLAQDDRALQLLSSSLAKNYLPLQKRRFKRMADLMQVNAPLTNIPEITDALTWARFSADALVTRQRGPGIWAGLPWFNNYWGRDTFISFAGTLLLSGQFQQARQILETFAQFQEQDENNPLLGRIPNRITNKEIIYNTADGTWWFVRAVYEYLLFSGDRDFAVSIFPVVQRAIAGPLKHKIDPHFFITHGDAETWMDAQYEKGAWSPRGNRAVEIQALWYSSLQAAAQIALWTGENNLAEYWLSIAGTLKENFIELYYRPVHGQLYDHLNTDDSKDNKIRPNQILAVTVPDLPCMQPLLPAEYQRRICNAVLQKLTYRYGVASLSQEDDDFHPWHHFEPFYPQDAAYHNGTVWTWLSGPVIAGLSRFHQEDLAFQLFINETNQILQWDAIGNFSELLDALPRPAQKNPQVSGTVSQAWSLAGYLSNFYRDFVGYNPDALHSAISFNPHFPYELNAVQVYLPYKMYRLKFTFQELEDSFVYQVETSDLIENITVLLNVSGYSGRQFVLSADEPVLYAQYFKGERAAYYADDDLEWYFAQPELRAGLKSLRGWQAGAAE
jgi:glycogen debranching enzyme